MRVKDTTDTGRGWGGEERHRLLTNGRSDVFIRYKSKALNYWNRSGASPRLVNLSTSGRMSIPCFTTGLDTRERISPPAPPPAPYRAAISDYEFLKKRSKFSMVSPMLFKKKREKKREKPLGRKERNITFWKCYARPGADFSVPS